MEASGFCQSARRVGSPDLMQVMKIVSDGPDAPPSVVIKYSASNKIPGTVVAFALMLASGWRYRRPPGLLTKVAVGAGSGLTISHLPAGRQVRNPELHSHF